jgi:hypothetical protein
MNDNKAKAYNKDQAIELNIVMLTSPNLKKTVVATKV